MGISAEPDSIHRFGLEMQYVCLAVQPHAQVQFGQKYAAQPLCSDVLMLIWTPPLNLRKGTVSAITLEHVWLNKKKQRERMNPWVKIHT